MWDVFTIKKKEKADVGVCMCGLFEVVFVIDFFILFLMNWRDVAVRKDSCCHTWRVED
jgi:hypothetical protein